MAMLHGFTWAPTLSVLKTITAAIRMANNVSPEPSSRHSNSG
jgi:hypothetical protein